MPNPRTELPSDSITPTAIEFGQHRHTPLKEHRAGLTLMSWAIRCHSTNDAHPTRKIRAAQRTCRDFDKDLGLGGYGNWDVKDFERLLKLDVTGKPPDQGRISNLF